MLGAFVGNRPFMVMSVLLLINIFVRVTSDKHILKICLLCFDAFLLLCVPMFFLMFVVFFRYELSCTKNMPSMRPYVDVEPEIHFRIDVSCGFLGSHLC